MILSTAVLCLALNVFHESRGEPLRGQVAVAQVTMNRAHANYGGDVCGAVFDRKQFSWTFQQQIDFPAMFAEAERLDELDGSEAEAWQRSIQVAEHAVSAPPTQLMYFHTTQVRPRWRTAMRRVAQIGRHVFYAAAPRKAAKKSRSLA